MNDYDFDSHRLYSGKTFEHNSATAIYFTVSSIFIAFLYAILINFSKSYIKAPKHFPPRGWLITFQNSSVNAPLIEVSNGDFREALERGSKLVRTFAPIFTMNKDNRLFFPQYPDKPYRIPHHPREWVIIPFKMIDEIKNAPESKLSFQQGSYDFFMGWHTGITNHERAVANILKTGINRLIDVVYAIVQDESLRTVLGNLGPCEGIRVCSCTAFSIKSVS